MKAILLGSLMLLSLLSFTPQASAEFVQKVPPTVEQQKRSKKAKKPKREVQPTLNREANARSAFVLSLMGLLFLFLYPIVLGPAVGVLGLISSLLALFAATAGLKSEQHGMAVVAVVIAAIVLTLLLATMYVTVLL